MKDYYRLCTVIYSGRNHSITGRTKLQKIVYFCCKFGWRLDYRLDVYGAVSYELGRLLKSMIHAGVISQEDGSLPTFKLTEKGVKFLKDYRTARDTDEYLVDKMTSLVNYLDAFEGKDLILASTLNYVQPHNKDLTTHDLITKVEHISGSSRNQVEFAWIKLRRIKSKIREISERPALTA